MISTTFQRPFISCASWPATSSKASSMGGKSAARNSQ